MKLMNFDGRISYLNLLFLIFVYRMSFSLRILENQFLGCFREALDESGREMLYVVRNQFENCAEYCILMDTFTFGMTDDGSCACMDAAYDTYNGYIESWCVNPCGGSGYSKAFTCGGGVIYMTFYRNCPPFTFGVECENYCLCASTMCHAISGVCYGKGCLDGVQDTSPISNHSFCYEINCDQMNGTCLTICQSDSPNYYQLLNCTCDTGYVFDALSFTCTDLNECSNEMTSECDICMNTMGSYTCYCFPPVELMIIDDKETCHPPPGYHHNCSACRRDQLCRSYGSVIRCICPDGEEVNGVCFRRLRCIDLNYCHYCVIELDFIMCQCREGYELYDDYMCTDINECEDLDCPRCVNFPGGALCQCPENCQCSDDDKMPTCESYTFKYHLMGEASFPNKGLKFFTHQPIAIGIFIDAPIKLSSTIWSSWSIPGLMNKTIKGTYLRIPPRSVQPGNYTATIIFTIYSRKRQTKLFFSIMTLTEYSLTERGVLVYEENAIWRRLEIQPILKNSEWLCSRQPRAAHIVYADLANTGCEYGMGSIGVDQYLEFNNQAALLAGSSQISFYFRKPIRPSQIAYDMTTFLTEISNIITTCVQNCGSEAKMDEDMVLQLGVTGLPENYYFYWHFDEANLFYYGKGFNKFVIPVEVLWKLEDREHTIYVKASSVIAGGEIRVGRRRFMTRKHEPTLCSMTLVNETFVLKERILKNLEITCRTERMRNFVLKEHNGTGSTWLYKGRDQTIRLSVALDDNLEKKYYIREVIFENGHQIDNDIPIDIESNEGPELNLESEINLIKSESLSIHERISKIHAVVTALNSKMKVKSNGVLTTENVDERNQLASILYQILKNTPLQVNKASLVVMTRSLESLTRYIEGVTIKNTRYYNVTEYVLKYKAIMIEDAGLDRAYEKLCKKEDYLGIVLRIIANLLTVHLRESETKYEDPENAIVKEFLQELMKVIKDSLDLVQRELIIIPKNIDIELDHLEINTFQLDGLTVNDFINLPNTDAFKKYRVQFNAPSSNLSAEIALVGYMEIKDNDVKLYVSPMTVNLTDKLTGEPIYPENGYKMTFNLSGQFKPIVHPFIASSVRMVLATSGIIANGTSIFQVIFNFMFTSEETSIHHIHIILLLCPERNRKYDFKTLLIICTRLLEEEVLLAQNGTWQKEMFLQRGDYLTNSFKLVVALENMFESLFINATLTINKMACMSLKNDKWRYNCKSELEPSENNHMICHCPLSQEYSAYKMNIPVTLLSTTSKEIKYTGINWVLIVWGIGILLALWAGKNDSRAELVGIPVDLPDNPLRGLYCYLVIINTGNVMNAGAFANVFLTLIGSTNLRTINCLKTCFFPVLRRGDKNVFIMRAKHSLGHILIVRLWHRGLENYSNWFVQDIKVVDLQTQSSYYFLCYSWLGTNFIGWNSSLVSIIVTYEDFHRINHLLPHNLYRYVQYKHRVLSIFFMSGTDRLSRFDRVVSLCFRIILVFGVSLFTGTHIFDVGTVYITVAGIQGRVVVQAFFAVLYTSLFIFIVDVVLLVMKWQAYPVIFAKDNILTTQRGVEVTSLRIVNNVLRLILHIIRPKDADIQAEDIEMGESFMGNTFFLRMKFFLRLFTPGVLLILSVMIILSISIFINTYNMREDRIEYWRVLVRISCIVIFFISDTLECIIIVLIFSFILKIEIHPEVINTEKILYAIRRELADASGLILADAIATRRKNIKYRKPIAKQFTQFTLANKLHGIVGLSRYIDILFAIIFMILLMNFFRKGLIGPSVPVTELNLDISRTFKEEVVRKISTKEEYWNYIEDTVLKQLHSTLNESNEENTTFINFEEFYLGEYNDTELEDYSKNLAFMRSVQAMFILPNNVTYTLRKICIKILATNIYSMIIIFEEYQPISWDSFCFTRNETENEILLRDAVLKSSLHKNIRGIAIKLFLYTPSVSVFSMVTMATINTPTGKLRSRMEIVNRKFETLANLKEILFFICYFLTILFLLIITYLLHVYYDGHYAYLIIFRHMIQTLSLAFGLSFILILGYSLLEKYTMHTDRNRFFGISYTNATEKLASMAFFLTFFFTTLRPILFIGKKFKLTKYYWNGTYTHLHQAYVLVVIVFIGQGVSYLWAMKGVYRLSSTRRAILISAVNIFRAGDVHKISTHPWAYCNVVIFSVIYTVVKWVIFTCFCYNKDWKEFKKAQQEVQEEPEPEIK